MLSIVELTKLWHHGGDLGWCVGTSSIVCQGINAPFPLLLLLSASCVITPCKSPVLIAWLLLLTWYRLHNHVGMKEGTHPACIVLQMHVDWAGRNMGHHLSLSGCGLWFRRGLVPGSFRKYNGKWIRRPRIQGDQNISSYIQNPGLGQRLGSFLTIRC